MTIIKGPSLESPTVMYSDDIGAGMTFTATKGINFWITFEATQVTSGQFVFTVWFKHVSGEGEEEMEAAPEGTPLNRVPRTDDEVDDEEIEEEIENFEPEDFSVTEIDQIVETEISEDES